MQPAADPVCRWWPDDGRSQSHLLAWIAAALASGLIKIVVNRTLILTVVKATGPATDIRAAVFAREPLYSDGAELAIAVIITHEITSSPFLALPALPFVPLHRSPRHAQLADTSRIDDKTGLLNAATWQREALLEIARP